MSYYSSSFLHCKTSFSLCWQYVKESWCFYLFILSDPLLLLTQAVCNNVFWGCFVAPRLPSHVLIYVLLLVPLLFPLYRKLIKRKPILDIKGRVSCLRHHVPSGPLQHWSFCLPSSRGSFIPPWQLSLAILYVLLLNESYWISALKLSPAAFYHLHCCLSSNFPQRSCLSTAQKQDAWSVGYHCLYSAPQPRELHTCSFLLRNNHIW